jgi:taurine dioxygenase
MTSIKVRNLGNEYSYGSIVEGLNWDTIKDDGVRADLNEIFQERGLIVFSGVEPSAKMQVAISNVFGPLKDHPTKTTPRIDDLDPNKAPGVIDMHYRPPADLSEDMGRVMLGGKKLVRYSPWHFDHCYNNELNRAGVLRATINAPEGGRTGFADGIELYRQMPVGLRQRIEGLNIIYTLDTRLSQMRFGRPEGFYVFRETPENIACAREATTFPRAMHPAVWTRKTGEKVLHVGQWMAFGIEHHEDPEGEALFEEVCQWIRKNAHGYWHNWKPTDMLIWDNWRMLHAVEGVDPKFERCTQRTTIKGDYGLGYFEGGKKIGEVQRELVMS